MLASVRRSARRWSTLPPDPNSRSNTIRGCDSIGTGVFSSFQKVLVNRQVLPSHVKALGCSSAISRDGTSVCFPIVRAAI